MRTAYAVHCIQRGALRFALASLKVCSCALGTPPFVVGSPFLGSTAGGSGRRRLAFEHEVPNHVFAISMTKDISDFKAVVAHGAGVVTNSPGPVTFDGRLVINAGAARPHNFKTALVECLLAVHAVRRRSGRDRFARPAVRLLPRG
jgi:hypothetical protein